MKKFILLFIILLVFSCKDDLDDAVIVNTTENLEVEDFIYKVMNYWYLWQEDVPNLADNKFTNDKDYTAFLQSFDGPEALYKGLQFSVDRYSYITDDYVAFQESQKGITLSNGMVFGLVRLSEGSSEIFGYVRYVLPNSDAKTKGIERGDIFSHVNGTKLTDTNFGNLLFSNAPSYTLDLANFSNNQITTTGESVTLSNSQQTEQSVHIAKVIEQDGKRVGYLMYNSFIEPQEENLKAAFADFVTAQIDELVIDLRYNSGGRVSTAQLMAGLIAGEHAGKVFGKLVYNEKRSAANREITITDADVQLGLSRVFFLTTKSSASASEMMVNGLKPYMNVIQIGDKTAGKDVGSNPFLDIIDNKNTINPNHTYLILPITFKYYNSENVGDYSDGLIPSIELPEILSNLGALGDVDEPLLKRALDYISGKRTSSSIKAISSSPTPFLELQLKPGRAIYVPEN